MKYAYKKGRANKKRSWAYPMIAFAILQSIFLFLEMISWTPNFRDGALFEKIYESKLFTEWFSPYSTPQYNLFTAVFAAALLPYAIVSAMKDVFSRN